jgi:hypothetical protein
LPEAGDKLRTTFCPEHQHVAARARAKRNARANIVRIAMGLFCAKPNSALQGENALQNVFAR